MYEKTTFEHRKNLRTINVMLITVLLWLTIGYNHVSACSGPITSFPATSNFENSFDGWAQSATDNIDWINYSGSTPSGATGPTSAYQGSYFIYVEATSPNNPYKVADLVSPCYQTAGTPVVDFAYHAYVVNTSVLNLQLSTDGVNWSTIWTSPTETGPSWQFATVTLSGYENTSFQLRLNATTGDTYRGDFAIDAFTVDEAFFEICNNGIDDDGDGFVDCADDDCGLALNREFDQGLNYWNLYNQSGSASTISIDNSSQLSGVNSSKIDVSTASGTDWHIQFTQNNITLEIGKTYTLSFSAKASLSRQITAAVDIGASPWTTFFWQPVSINTSGQDFSYTFTAGSTVSTCRVIFNLGETTGSVWLDNIQLKEVCSIAEICNNGIDDDGDGLVDSNDTDCQQNQVCSCIGQNGFSNPSFENGNYIGADVFIPGVSGDDLGYNWGTPSGLDGWSHGPLWWVESNKASDGNRMVYINNPSGGAVCQGQYYSFGSLSTEINPCTEYQVCFDWASFNRDFPAGRSTTSQPGIDFTWIDASGNDLGASHVNVGFAVANQNFDNLSWSSVSYQFSLTGALTPPAGAVQVRVNLSEQDGQDNGILVDNANMCVVQACSEICDNGIDDDGDGLIDCADTDCAPTNITLTGMTMGSCIDQPLADIADMTFTLSYTNPPLGQDLLITYENKVIRIPSGTASPITRTVQVSADGIQKNISARWVGSTCPIEFAYTPPSACSNDLLSCNILYLCGLDKPYDGDAYDHGVIEYILANNGSSALVPILTKNEAGMGTYNPMDASIFIPVTLTDYDMVIVSPTTEGHISTDLINALKTFSGGVLNGNYLIQDELGMTNGATEGVNWGNNAYLNNTTSTQILRYDNPGSWSAPLTTFGDPLPSADQFMWAYSGDQAAGVNAIVYRYDETDVLPGVSSHGPRVYSGFHMNGLYANNINNGALPSPASVWFNPVTHLTKEGKEMFDKALIMAGTHCVPEDCIDGKDNDLDGLVDCLDPECQNYSFPDTLLECNGDIAPTSIDLYDAIPGYSWSLMHVPSGSNPTIDPQSGVITNMNIAGQYIAVFSGPSCGDTIEVAVPSCDLPCFCDGTSDEGYADWSVLGNSVINGPTVNNFTLNIPGHHDVDVTQTLDSGGKTNQTNNNFTNPNRKAFESLGYIPGINQPMYLESNAFYSQTVDFEFASPMGNIDLLIFDIDQTDQVVISAVDYLGNTITDLSGWTIRSSGDATLWENGSDNIAPPPTFDSTTGTVSSSDPANYNRSFIALRSDVMLSSIKLVFSGSIAGSHVYYDLYGVLPKTPCDAPSVAANADDTTLCVGEGTTISAVGSGGTAPYSFVWDNGLGSGSTHNVSPNTTTTYNVTITDSKGCTEVASVDVSVFAKPTVNISGPTQGCEGDIIVLTAVGVTGSKPVTNYIWSDGSTTNTLTTTLTGSITYSVTVTSDNGCTTVGNYHVAVIPESTVISVVADDDSICVGQSTTLHVNKNIQTGGLIDYSTWTVGSGSIGAFLRNGNVIENQRYVSTGPWDNNTIIWEAVPEAATGPDGGWTHSAVPIDNTKTYRYSVWINRKVIGADGRAYFGMLGAGSANGLARLSNGTTNTNPYFWVSNNPPNTIAQDEWVLLVGHVYPNDHTGTQNHPESGKYTVDNGRIGNIQTDYKWLPGTTTARPRTFLYYCTDISVRQQMVYPRFDVIDGTEPTVDDLLAGFDINGGLSGNANWVWYADACGTNPVGTGSSISVSPSQTTTYYVRGEGTCKDSDCTPVTVYVESISDFSISSSGILNCNNLSVDLTAPSGYASYLWDDGSTNVTRTVNTAGTYTITVTNARGCTKSSSIEVTADNDVPVANAGVDQAICSGNVATLSATGGGSYLWSHGLGSGSSVNVAPPSTTTYTVTVSDVNGCTASDQVTVGVSQNLSVGIDFNGSVCISDVSQLTALPTDGIPNYSYLWSGPSGFNSTLQTIDIIHDGNYYVTVTDAAGCTATTTGYVFESYNPVIVTLQSEVCEGESLSLAISSSTAQSYIWSANAGGSSSSSVTVTPSYPSSTYQVTVTNNQGCTNVATTTIGVKLRPNTVLSGDDILCIGDNTQFLPSSGGTWIANNPSVAMINNQGLATAITGGSASFTFIEDGGCSSNFSTPIQVIPSPIVSLSGPSTICVGQNTYVSGNVAGSWSNSNPSVASITSSGEVLGLSAGITTFTFYESTRNCQGNQSLTIVVSDKPDVYIEGNNELCIGETTQLQPSSGGTWTSSNVNIATVDNSGLVTSLAVGAVDFTFTSNTGCVSEATDDVTITNKPTISVPSNYSMCIGDQLQLFPNTDGTWTSTNTSVATITNTGLVTSVSAGSVSFFYTKNNSGCQSDISNPISIVSGPGTSITGANRICIGESTTLSPTSGGTWVSSNDNIATVNNNGTVTGVNAGIVQFTFIDNVTNCPSVNSPEVTVDPKPNIGYTGPSTVCLGGNTLLYPTTGGVWTSSNTSVATVNSAGQVSAIGVGVAVFTFQSNTTGCSAITSTALTVTDVPTISIDGADSLCIGSTTQLLSSITGTWISSNPLVASVSNDGIVTAMQAGSVTFTLSSNGQCNSNPSDVITVLPKPTISFDGPTVLCIDETSSISASSSNGSWLSTNPAVATIDALGSITALTQGVVRFIFNSSDGCASDQSTSLIVNGKPTAQLGEDQIICIGSTTQLFPTFGGSWTSSNSAIATVDNSGLVTALASGNVSFIFTDSNTSCASDATQPLTVADDILTFISGADSICIGNTTSIFPSTGGQWLSLNPSVASISNDGLITGISSGIARFIFTDYTTGCISDTSTVVTVVSNLTVDFLGDQELCIGDTTYLSPNSGGTWFSTNPSVATIDNSGLVIAKTQGSARFQYTDTATGCDSELSAPLIVHGAPTVYLSGSSIICVGNSTTLISNSLGSWESLNPTIASVDNNGNVIGLSPGIAYFQFTDAATGCKSDGTLNLEVTEAIEIDITGDTEICLGFVTTLSPTYGGVWISNNPDIASVSANGVVTGRAPGKVTFEFLSSQGGCISSGTTGVITVLSCINDDFNVTKVGLSISSDISTNDNASSNVTYNPLATILSKPIGSNPDLQISTNGSYTFDADKEGKYIYRVQICNNTLSNNCYASVLEITVVDHVHSYSSAVANREHVTTYTDSNSAVKGQTVILDPLANDKCVYTGSCTLTSISIVKNGSKGQATLGADNKITYIPNEGEIGLDTLMYTVCTSDNKCSTTSEIVTINHTSADNTIVASDDFTYTSIGQGTSGTVLGNDMDPELDAMVVNAVGSALSPINIIGGSYYIDASGSYTFIPNPGFTGYSEFSYTVCDDNIVPNCTNATVHILVFNDMALKLRVYLEGALMNNGNQYSSTGKPLMRDNLRFDPVTGEGYLPSYDPYSQHYTTYLSEEISLRYTKLGPGLVESNRKVLDSLTVFGVTGENAIVDWVFVELRSKNDMTQAIATRSGLLQRDGDIVDLDGFSDLRFTGINIDSFYVYVKHRNHLGVMSMLVSNDEVVDFTNPQTEVFNYGNSLGANRDYSGLSQNPNVINGYQALWAGDFNSDGYIKFVGGEVDVNILYQEVLDASVLYISNYNYGYGYSQGDYNMDGKIKFTNPNDDTNLLYAQLILYALNVDLKSNYGFFIQQVP